MDWHFRVHQRMVEAEKRGQHRSWYVDELVRIIPPLTKDTTLTDTAGLDQIPGNGRGAPRQRHRGRQGRPGIPGPEETTVPRCAGRPRARQQSLSDLSGEVRDEVAG